MALAGTKLTPSKVLWNDGGTPKASFVSAVDGTAKTAYFEWKNPDQKVLLILTDTDASDDVVATIKAGNGLQGNNDVTITLGEGETTYLLLESGRFKNVSGDYKGCCVITGSTTDLSVGVLFLD